MTSNKHLLHKLTTLTLSSTLVLSTLGLIPSAARAATNAPSISNASFETYTGTNGVADGWTKYSPPETFADLQVVDSPVHEGSRAQKISASGIPAGKYVDVYQLISVTPGTQYAVSGMFNIESLTNANVQLYIDYYDAAGKRIGAASTTQSSFTNGYIKLDNIHVTPANAASMRVYALLRSNANGGAGTFYVDNLTIRQTASALSNASFETYTGTNGVADFWRATVPPTATADLAVVDAPAAAGNRAQKVSGSNLKAGESIHVYQTVAAQPNTSYTVTGQFNIESLDRAKVQFYIDYYNADGQWLKAYPVEHTETTDGYIELKNEGITPSTTGYFRVYAVLRGLADGASGTFYVDDIKVQETPPAIVPETLIPLMTSNTAPLGRASGSQVSPNTAPYLALDRSAGTYWEGVATNAWLGYDFGTSAIVTQYAITPTTASENAPQSWQFQAYDGTSWITLDTQTVTNWSPESRQLFKINNSNGYLQYRLTVTASNGTTTQIAELEMFGAYAIPATPSDLKPLKNEDSVVSLNWSPLNGVTGYNLYQDGVKINAEPITSSSYTINDLTNGTIYSYQVSAVNPAGESPKSPQVLAMPFTAGLLPTMTSDTAPLGVASGTYNYTNAYRAFDKKSTTAWQSKPTQQGLTYDIQTPAVVREYTLQSSANSANAPKSWEFQGYDGTTWVPLDQQTATGWSANSRQYFTFRNDTPYTQYRLWTNASNGGTYTEIAELEMVGEYTRPAAPQGLTSPLSGNGTVRLSWNPVNGAIGYNVYADGQKVNEQPITNTTYNLTGLTNNHLYHLTVTTLNTAGESPQSSEILAMPYTTNLVPTMTSNTAPIGASAASASTTNAYRAFDKSASTIWSSTSTAQWIEYDFQTPAVIQQYTIQSSTTPSYAPKSWKFEGFDGTAWVPLDTQQNVSGWSSNQRRFYTIANETAYSKYRLNISASNGSSLHLAEMELIGDFAVPSAPRGLSNLSNADGTVHLSWLPLNSVTGYNLYADGRKLNAEPITGTTYAATGLTNNQVYRFAVSALNQAGESAPSEEIIAMPFQDSLIPAMTADNAPSGAASGSYNYTNPFKAFDRSPATSWESQASAQWIAYDFQSPVTVKEYVLQANTKPGYAPKTWTFQGFDGTNWIDLDTRTVTGWKANERKYYTINNDTAYAKYRLSISTSNGSLTQIAELEMAGTR